MSSCGSTSQLDVVREHGADRPRRVLLRWCVRWLKPLWGVGQLRTQIGSAAAAGPGRGGLTTNNGPASVVRRTLRPVNAQTVDNTQVPLLRVFCFCLMWSFRR